MYKQFREKLFSMNGYMNTGKDSDGGFLQETFSYWQVCRFMKPSDGGRLSYSSTVSLRHLVTGKYLAYGVEKGGNKGSSKKRLYFADALHGDSDTVHDLEFRFRKAFAYDVGEYVQPRSIIRVTSASDNDSLHIVTTDVLAGQYSSYYLSCCSRSFTDHVAGGVLMINSVCTFASAGQQEPACLYALDYASYIQEMSKAEDLEREDFVHRIAVGFKPGIIFLQVCVPVPEHRDVRRVHVHACACTDKVLCARLLSA